MAQTVVIGNETFKKRNEFGVWLGLPFITLGIYHYVWYYKINNEARRFLRDDSIHPWVSVVAILFGGILIVPPFYSVYQTCVRVRRMEEQAGVPGRIEPVLGLVLMFVLGLHVLYIQSHLNSIWSVYLRSQPMTPPMGMPAPGAAAQSFTAPTYSQDRPQ